MKITFLGTSAMLPTADRNHSAIFLEHQQEGILIDCGEGTQKQLRIAHIKPSKISKILITHFHGDHMLGIPGIIQNLAVHNYQSRLQIYGPPGLKSRIKKLLAGIIFQGKLDMKVNEISPSIFCKNKEFSLECKKLNHGNIICYGYAFKEADKLKINIEYTQQFGLTQHPILKQLQQGKSILWKGKKIPVKLATIKKPGKKIAIILDTRSCPAAISLAKNADLAIIESTWLDSENKTGYHLTAEQAASIAKAARCKKLALTHFSQRYSQLSEFELAAKKVFPNTFAAKDFLSLEV